MLKILTTVLVLVTIFWVHLTLGHKVKGSTTTTVRRSIVRNFTDCGSEGKILQVQIPGCPNPPCDFQVGQNYVVAAYFKGKYEHHQVQAFFSVVVGEIETTIIDLTSTVDVEAGSIMTFGYSLAVTESLGIGLGTLKMTVGEGGVNELCFTVSAKIRK